MPLTKEKLATITATMIRAASAWARRGRMNAHKRGLLQGIDAGGDEAKASVIYASRHYASEIFLDESLRDAIEKYLAWDSSKDPSKLGALNLAAYIGEQVAARYRIRLDAVIGPSAATKDE